MPDGDSALMRRVLLVHALAHRSFLFERQCVDQAGTGKQEAAARSGCGMFVETDGTEDNDSKYVPDQWIGMAKWHNGVLFKVLL